MNGRANSRSHTDRALSSWRWMPMLVLALGLASLLMLVATNHIYERVIFRDQSRVDAVEEVQLALTTVHLWLEEYLTGDRIDIDELDAQLVRAATLVDALLTGAEFPDGDLAIVALADPALRSRARGMQARVQGFREISESRELGYEQGESVGVGSEFDVIYDRAFRLLLQDARELTSALQARQVRNRTRAGLLFRSMLAAWVLIVVLSVFGLWSRDLRRARAEAALQRSQTQLLQSQKMDAVGRLAGGISHDINNYLGAIRAQGELVQMRAGPEDPLSGKMESIIRAVDKASSLIEQLLAFSRKQPTRPEVVDLNQVIKEGVGTLARRLLGEDVQFETRLEPRLWAVKIDPSQIEQVIVNLVVNARQAMPTGGAVTISTENRQLDDSAAQGAGLSSPGSYVVLSVSDSGPGISEEIREKIFEPFFTTQPTATSSGLGLSMVYGLIEQNHGAVRLHSRLGRGATFEIYLPRSRESVAERAAIARRIVEPIDAGGTILLVEDNDELRQSMRTMVETLGYEVIAATGGDEAMRFFDEVADDIDLVISDVLMPGMNGKELVSRLRQRRDDLKVLYVSGNTGNATVKDAIVGGQTAFLKKPFSADALVRKIRELTESP